MYFLFKNKTLQLSNWKTRTAMDANISNFVICVKAIIYLFSYKLHDCAFKPLHPLTENLHLWGYITEIVSFSLSIATIVIRQISSIYHQYHSVHGKQKLRDELHWLAPTHGFTKINGHVVLQDHVTSQNHYISAKTVPIASKPGFIFSCSYCSCTIFTSTSYFLYTQSHANLYFNQCSLFT